MATSQNGWKASPSSANFVSFKWVTGRVVPGDVAWVFDDFCKWFDENIENIRRDWSWGYAYRAIRGATTGLSNHASGTAIDLNAPKHPIGKRNTFSASDRAKIRARLKRYSGAIRWGGDYAGRPDDMHFEINVSSSRLKSIVDSLKNGDAKPVTSKPPVKVPSKETPKTVHAVSVRTLKTRLKKIGFYKGTINDKDDAGLRSAIKAYQKAQSWNRLVADGIWGAKTEKHYAYVLRLQKALNKWKSNLTKLVEDGSFGGATTRKVREIQQRNKTGAYRRAGGRVVDGIPGPVMAKMLGIKYL